jgi:aspartyl-tRNA(Asn)/glutamyl-tRNA(Gln) amidotransferase subunit A
MQDDELWRLGIDDLGELFSSGQAQPTEVLASILGRISAVGPRLNAFATLDADGATAAARASDERWQRRQQRGPLDGVPLSIKDNIPVAGLHCCWGSKLFRDFRPERDELPVSRLRMAGAVLLGKTNVSEFTVGPGGTVHTEAFGTTRNPWDLRLTTGSSSGGGGSDGNGRRCARNRWRWIDPAPGLLLQSCRTKAFNRTRCPARRVADDLARL